MKPVHCRVAHEPENGKYGDCVRACVASLLELEPEDVPHFYEDNASGEIGTERVRQFLATKNLAPFYTYFDGAITFTELMNVQRIMNPSTYYMLFHRTESGDHVVICKGGEVDFDPAWYRSKVAGPNSNGFWGVMVIAKQ